MRPNQLSDNPAAPAFNNAPPYFYAAKSGQFVEETFQGSLPAFIAAFASGKKLSKKEMDEIQQMIDDFREKADD